MKKGLRTVTLSFCDPDWIQTNDPKLRRFVLYSAELPGLIVCDRKKSKRPAPGILVRMRDKAGPDLPTETAAKLKNLCEGAKPFSANRL
jgi:hypothetical protein